MKVRAQGVLHHVRGELRETNGLITADLRSEPSYPSFEALLIVNQIQPQQWNGRWIAKTSVDEGIIHLHRADTIRSAPEPVDQRYVRFHPSDTTSLSPLGRVSQTFDYEVDLGTTGVFDEERYKGYLKMLQVTGERRDSQFKALALLDAVIVLLLFGQSIKVPGTEITLSALPAALEAVTFGAAVAFFSLQPRS